MTALVDTNILVYRFDSRFPDKHRLATELLEQGIDDGSIALAHQAIVEFVAAVSRPLADGRPLLEPMDARREAEEFLGEFDVSFRTRRSSGSRSGGRRPTSSPGSTRTCGRSPSASASTS